MPLREDVDMWDLDKSGGMEVRFGYSMCWVAGDRFLFRRIRWQPVIVSRFGEGLWMDGRAVGALFYTPPFSLWDRFSVSSTCTTIFPILQLMSHSVLLLFFSLFFICMYLQNSRLAYFFVFACLLDSSKAGGIGGRGNCIWGEIWFYYEMDWKWVTGRNKVALLCFSFFEVAYLLALYENADVAWKGRWCHGCALYTAAVCSVLSPNLIFHSTI